MALDLTGKLHKVFEIEQKTESFKARDFVVETPGEYPQFVKFQLTQDKCTAIEKHNEGDEITVHFDLRGKEWQGKYFTNLNAWKIDGSSSSGGSAPTQQDNFNQSAAPASNTNASNIDSREDLDDLPF